MKGDIRMNDKTHINYSILRYYPDITRNEYRFDDVNCIQVNKQSIDTIINQLIKKWSDL